MNLMIEGVIGVTVFIVGMYSLFHLIPLHAKLRRLEEFLYETDERFVFLESNKSSFDRTETHTILMDKFNAIVDYKTFAAMNSRFVRMFGKDMSKQLPDDI